MSTTSQPSPQPWLRPAKQFSLFLLGATLTAASVAVSRRSVLRRQRLSVPRFYTANPAPPNAYHHLPHPPASSAASSSPQPPSEGSSEGVLLGLHALGLATLNVCGFAVLLTGGLGWGFDLSSVEELRERTQRALWKDGTPAAASPEEEEAFESMVNDVLARLGMDKVDSRALLGAQAERRDEERVAGSKS